MAAPSDGPRRPPHLVVAALFFLLAGLIQTSPLVRHFGESVPYTAQPHPGHEIVPVTQGDHLQLIYHFRLFGDSLERGRPFSPVPLEFRVDREPPGSFSPQFFPLSFLWWILSPLGAAAAYNFLILLSYVFSGLAAFLLCSLFFPPLPSFVGGLVFCSFPFRYGQLMGGHSNGFVSFFAPLAVALLIIAFRRRSPAVSFLAGLAFFFLCTTDITAAYFTSFLFLPLLLFLFALDFSGSKNSTDSLPEPDVVAGILDTPLLPFLAGCAAGIAYAVYRIHHSLDSALSAASVLAVVFHGLLALMIWSAAAGLLCRLTKRPPTENLGSATVLFMPLFLLLLYPAVLFLPVPGLGRTLAVLSAGSSFALFIRLLLRLRRDLSPSAPSSVHERLRIALPALLVTFAAFSLVTYQKQSQISSSSIGSGRTYEEVRLYSPQLTDFLALDLSDAEKVLYPGAAAVLLATLFLLGGGVFRSGGERRFLLSFFTWSGLVAALLALGPGGEGVSPLFPLLRGLVPLYDLSRAPSRIFLLSAVTVAVFSAGGAAVIVRRLGPRLGVAASLLLVGAVSLDFQPPSVPGLSGLPAASEVYRSISEEIGEGKVLDIPLWPGDSSWSSLYLHYASLYGTPTVNGYSPIVPGDYRNAVFLPLEDVNLGEIRAPQYQLLRDLDVRFVVLHEEAFPPQVSPYPSSLTASNLTASPYLTFIRREGPLRLFAVEESPPEGEPSYTAHSVMGKVFEGEHHAHARGDVREVSGSSGGRVASFPHLWDGPLNRPFPRKGSYPSGYYRFRAAFQTEDGKAPSLTVEVRDRSTGGLIGSPAHRAAVSWGGDDSTFFVEGDFRLLRPVPLSFSLSSGGESPLSWDYLYLLRGDSPDPQWTFEAEDLIHMGLETPHPLAESGGAVEIQSPRDPRDFVLLGPDRLFPPGRYRAELLALPSGGDPGERGRFEVLIAGTDAPLSAVPLAGEGSPGFSPALEFSLVREVPVRFRVFFKGPAGLLIDRIQVARSDGD